jgi:hypothetical protein
LEPSPTDLDKTIKLWKKEYNSELLQLALKKEDEINPEDFKGIEVMFFCDL